MEPPPENCPSVSSDLAGKAEACAGCPNQKLCSSGEAKQAAVDEINMIIPLIRERLAKVKHIILVISGKGGTGKSTVSTNLARSLATDPDLQIGLLDLDICGPSTPRMFDLEGEQVHKSITGWIPVYATDNLSVMSCGFLLDSLDDAVIWRGPKKNTMIKQFLMDVDWGELDYLIIDTPPGTSDEHISVVNYLKQTNLPNVDGAVIVTTPQEVSLMDVRKQIDFCRKTNINILGVVENMAKFICPKCSKGSTIFPSSSGGTEKLASDYGLEILGSLPLNPLVGRYCDSGMSIFEEPRVSGDKYLPNNDVTTIAALFNKIKNRIIKQLGHQ